MLKPNKKCAVCKIVRTNKKLLERIYNSSHFIPHSKDTLMDIWRDYNPEGTHAFGYDSIKNHVKMHQFINSADYQEKMLHKVDKEVEAAAVRKAVKAVDAVQSIIDQGTEKLENGELSINTNHLLRASQIKMQHDQKEKDKQPNIQLKHWTPPPETGF